MREVNVTLESKAFSCDGLEVVSFKGKERISSLYEFDLEVVVRSDDAPTAEAIAGSSVRLVFAMQGKPARFVQSIVGRVIDRLDPVSGLRGYQLRLVPELFLMTQVMLQGVFRGSVPHILSEKLRACQIRSEFRLSGTYPERDYVGQFAETDFAFVSRLAEHLGIAYFYAYDEEGERVVFTDDNLFRDLRGQLSFPFRGRGERTDIYRFETEANVATSLVMVADYNYRTPETAILGRYEVPKGTGGGTIEFGPHVRTAEEANAVAKIRGEAIECRRVIHHGESDRAALGAGVMFTMTDHPHLGDLDLLVVEVEHRIERTGDEVQNGALSYTNRFVAIPATTPFRPERVTPVPRVSGLLNGIVLSDPNSDQSTPWLDEAGRYRIGLLFDTLSATADDPAARPMRMVQAQAGPGYGIHFPLRPGTEIVVGFVNGDIDRPLIVGAVPNTSTPSPVHSSVPLYNRIRTASGVTLEFEDGT
jgi:type VI secretion system secreted protein VgrG